ncbi:MAG: glutamine synthetase III [Firmicutes bacterium]|nr:glutamine synthetase III [Bacillota bacterium]
MKDIPGIFGSMVFNDDVMRSRLPGDTYRALVNTMARGARLELGLANVLAAVMKNWAVEKGATHFTHWFQPMTGITAEKHESFISPAGGGTVIMEFSGKELVRGEPDASSFPSGGLRATFEARGYTVWDTTSYAFIKDGTLCIPTAFCSYSGEALDKKTPLLRSMDALDIQVRRVLVLFGNADVKRVTATVGPEQEYFLIDKEVFLKRPDLMYTGRTLFGAKPPKGQELDDHYFGALKPRVSAFMKELDEELWKLGVLAKTRHNETAPAQHELAPIYTTVNIATDHNQLTMETMKSVANRHSMACLLHEKPFDGVNGSGKHINWSLSTDAGANLLEPGDTPHENAQFLLFLVAVIKAVDDYQELLRVSAASAGNDHRLGAHEAPPAIVSVFLGDELTGILEAIETGAAYNGADAPLAAYSSAVMEPAGAVKGGGEKRPVEIGITALPYFPRDTTDRNRTSPIAFTGNRFELRMVGSAFSIACPNFILNTIVAETLRVFADSLENTADFRRDLTALIRTTIKNHKRVIFNGNNYSAQWAEEAKKRGLSELRTTVDALPAYIQPKNAEVMARHHVLSESEIRSRYQILLDEYAKTIHIEALTMEGLVKREIIPAVLAFERELAALLRDKKAVGEFGRGFGCETEEFLLAKTSELAAALLQRLRALEDGLSDAGARDEDVLARARFHRDVIYGGMAELRVTVDELETLVPKGLWRLPTYAEMLYSVN